MFQRMGVDRSHKNGTPRSDFEASAVKDEQADVCSLESHLAARALVPSKRSDAISPITRSPNQNLVLIPSTTKLLCTNRLALGHDLEKTT